VNVVSAGFKAAGYIHLYLTVYKIHKSPSDMQKLITSNHSIFLFSPPDPRLSVDMIEVECRHLKKADYRLIVDLAISQSLFCLIAGAKSNP
jgi:two-component SAPR family response regulator